MQEFCSLPVLFVKVRLFHEIKVSKKQMKKVLNLHNLHGLQSAEFAFCGDRFTLDRLNQFLFLHILRPLLNNNNNKLYYSVRIK